MNFRTTDDCSMETEPAANATQPKSRRRWHQFSSRTLLIVVTAIAVAVGTIALAGPPFVHVSARDRAGALHSECEAIRGSRRRNPPARRDSARSARFTGEAVEEAASPPTIRRKPSHRLRRAYPPRSAARLSHPASVARRRASIKSCPIGVHPWLTATMPAWTRGQQPPRSRNPAAAGINSFCGRC